MVDYQILNALKLRISKKNKLNNMEMRFFSFRTTIIFQPNPKLQRFSIRALLQVKV